MTATEPLILFSRAQCHLCDLVAEMLDRAAVPWRPVDIDGDPLLTEKYGLRVPVLQHPGSRRELSYPFGDAELLRFFEGKE